MRVNSLATLSPQPNYDESPVNIASRHGNITPLMTNRVNSVDKSSVNTHMTFISSLDYAFMLYF